MLDLFVRRWGLKLLALAIAFAIWLAVQDSPPPLGEPVNAGAESPADVTFDGVPVTLVGGDGASLVDPAAVRVRVVGPPALVTRIRPAHIRAIADVTGLAPRASPHEVPLSVVLEDLSPSDSARVTARPVGRSRIEVYISGRRDPS